MSAIGVAVIDANLLVPIVACDFLLTAFDRRLFEPIVSTTVLNEVERTLIDDFPRVDPAGLRRRVQHMRSALVDQTDQPLAFTGAVEAINAKDRHVVAAAMVAEATMWSPTTECSDPRSPGRRWSSNRSKAMPSPGACGTRHRPM